MKIIVFPEPGNLTPGRDSPAVPRLRSVNSYTNIRAATTARNLNKSLQNLNVNEEGMPHMHTPSSSSADTRGRVCLSSSLVLMGLQVGKEANPGLTYFGAMWAWVVVGCGHLHPAVHQVLGPSDCLQATGVQSLGTR